LGEVIFDRFSGRRRLVDVRFCSGAQRFFNGIKQRRRVATRYDRLAANDLAFVLLASIRLWLRLNEAAA